MKRKIIALLMATVCATTFFAACDEQASSSDVSEVKCDVHSDADKDALCDACGKAIVVVKEEIPAEKEQPVDMVVNPIPTDTVLSDYFTATVENEAMPTSWKESAVMAPLYEQIDDGTVEIKGGEQLTTSGIYATVYQTITKKTVEDKEVKFYKNVYMIFDAVNDVKVAEWVSDEYEEGKAATQDFENFSYYHDSDIGVAISYTIESLVKNEETTNPDDTIKTFKDVTLMYSQDYGKVLVKEETATYKASDSRHDDISYDRISKGVFIMTTEKWEEDEDTSSGYNRVTTHTVYLPNGEIIASANKITECAVKEKDDVLYVTVNDTKYAYDAETYALLHKEEAALFIERPEFDEKNDKYGYVMERDGIYVYDLSKWLECVYSVTAPSYWLDVYPMVLENGNVLVQYKKILPSNAVSYDIYDENYKGDVNYVILNPADGTQKEVEFGYSIQTMIDKEEIEGVTPTDKALNLLVVNPIEDKQVNENKTHLFVVDNELNILYELKGTLPGQGDEMTAIATNRFITSVGYAEGTQTMVIVNEKGELVAKLPNTANIKDGYINVNGNIYDFDMKLKLDTKDYDEVIYYDTYVYLEKNIEAKEATDTEEATEAHTEAYIFNLGMTAPKKIADDATKVFKYVDYIRVTKETPDTEGTGDDAVETTKITYVFYNSNCEVVGEFDSQIVTYVAATETTPARLQMSDGKIYYAK